MVVRGHSDDLGDLGDGLVIGVVKLLAKLHLLSGELGFALAPPARARAAARPCRVLQASLISVSVVTVLDASTDPGASCGYSPDDEIEMIEMIEMTERTGCVIVGGGPAGMVAGLLL